MWPVLEFPSDSEIISKLFNELIPKWLSRYDFLVNKIPANQITQFFHEQAFLQLVQIVIRNKIKKILLGGTSAQFILNILHNHPDFLVEDEKYFLMGLCIEILTPEKNKELYAEFGHQNFLFSEPVVYIDEVIRTGKKAENMTQFHPNLLFFAFSSGVEVLGHQGNNSGRIYSAQFLQNNNELHELLKILSSFAAIFYGIRDFGKFFSQIQDFYVFLPYARLTDIQKSALNDIEKTLDKFYAIIGVQKAPSDDSEDL